MSLCSEDAVDGSLLEGTRIESAAENLLEKMPSFSWGVLPATESTCCQISIRFDSGRWSCGCRYYQKANLRLPSRRARKRFNTRHAKRWTRGKLRCFDSRNSPKNEGRCQAQAWASSLVLGQMAVQRCVHDAGAHGLRADRFSREAFFVTENARREQPDTYLVVSDNQRIPYCILLFCASCWLNPWFSPIFHPSPTICVFAWNTMHQFIYRMMWLLYSLVWPATCADNHGLITWRLIPEIS